MSFFDKIRKFDAYPKTLSDFQIRTFSGAIVTIIATSLMVFLFLSELYDYLLPTVDEELFVDTTRGEKLKINLDLIFPVIPCDLLSLDALDQSGVHQINVEHNIYKRQLDLNGSPLQDPKRIEDIGHTVFSYNISDAVQNATLPKANIPKCGSCYGAEYGDLKCCSTCDEVKEAYRRKGWALPPAKNIDQCVSEGKVDVSEELPKEGCQIYGYVEVNRVAGNFHIAPGKSYQHSHLHVHDVQQYRTTDFELSHRIRHLSFGINIPGKTNPLDGYEYKTKKGARNINYFIKIVPTTYERIDGSTLMTNQFSVTRHEKVLHLGFGESSIPGVFFTYELGPMMVKYSERKKSLGHFLTGICAIIGGVFTVAGLIDSFIYHSSRAFRRKMQLGKAS